MSDVKILVDLCIPVLEFALQFGNTIFSSYFKIYNNCAYWLIVTKYSIFIFDMWSDVLSGQ